jgi:hypothetical protein
VWRRHPGHGDSVGGAGRSRLADTALLGSALRRCSLALSCISLLALAAPATGFAVERGGLLADAASAVDYYQVTCSNDGSGVPQSLAVQVRDRAPVSAPLVSVQAQKGFAATNTTDPMDGDSNPSPVAAVNGGAGAYDVFVDKSAAGPDGYSLTAECKTGLDGAGGTTGTAIVPIATSGPPIPALPPFAAGFLVTLLMTCVALRGAAHTATGSLGDGASATDFYQVTCSDDDGPTRSLVLQVTETTGGEGLVGVQGQRGAQVTNSVDTVSGDTNPSPLAFVNGADGVFDVLVYKTAADAASYTLLYHCYTGDNGAGHHTGTTIVLRQNQ